MSEHIASQCKVYKYVYHYPNVYRISISINNKNIVKTVPDRYTKSQLRIAITTMMRENGLNEAQITKAMTNWGEEGTNTHQVNFAKNNNKTGYLGVCHKIWLSRGTFVNQYNKIKHDNFSYPIRQFAEGVFWIKKTEMLDAYEQACNASDIERYGEILIRERPEPKNDFLKEMKEYCYRKNLAHEVRQVIITDSITSLIKTINASKTRTEHLSAVNVTGHKLIHPYIDSKNIGYKITPTSNPLPNEVFAVPLQQISNKHYIANSTELEIKFNEACTYVNEKFKLDIKPKSKYTQRRKEINWSALLLTKIRSAEKIKLHFYSNNEAGNLKQIIYALLAKDLLLIKPYFTSAEIGYCFDINGEKYHETIPLKKINEKYYWVHPTKVLKLYLDVYKEAEKSAGLISRPKSQHKAERTDEEWLIKLKSDFTLENTGLNIHISEKVGELREQCKNEEREARLAKEKQELLEKALANEAKLTKEGNNEDTGHKLVQAKVLFGHAVYLVKKHGRTEHEIKIKLTPLKNSEFTISRAKLINAFVKICRKADQTRNIKDISDDTYKSLYQDVNWLAKARSKNKRFKSIKVVD